MKKIASYMISLLGLFCACTQKDGLVTPDELGVRESRILLQCAPGTCTVEVFCDGDFTATLSDDSWISFTGMSGRVIGGNGDSFIGLDFEYNRGLRRESSMILSHGRKTLKVEFIQNGVLSSDIALGEHSVSLQSSPSDAAVKILSVYKDSDLDFVINYAGDGGWIQDVSKVNNFITFTTLENTLDVNRYAEVVISCKSDPSVSDRFQVCQLGKSVELTEISFPFLKTLAEPGTSVVLDKPYVLEAVVIGDDAQGNGGENINISASLQDATLSARTMYVQNDDASMGVKIVFDKAQSNILRRFDRVRLNLEGTVLNVCGGTSPDDPLRCEITGLTSAGVLASTSGSQYDLPQKEKYIGELTDDDVYTYLTLKECEIPVRKGPFVPIDIRHRQVIHSYPMVIRDINGSTSHIMTNLGASWERDGNGLPQGSGDISGVLVHETCDNFAWNVAEAMDMIQDGILPDYITGVGNIGRYQIRPFTREEIDLLEDFENGFSEMIMEIRYYSTTSTDIVKNVASKNIYSTYPAVPDPLYDSSIKGKMYVVNKDGSIGNTALWRDWTHVGPYVNGLITEPANGNGVDDYYGTPTEFVPYSGVSTTALIMKSSAWYSGAGWCTDKYWCVSFSTEGLTAANFPLSVQIGAISGLGQTVGAPRYWILEYSVNGSTWKSVEEYTVPDFPILSNRKPWQCPGPKYMSINLPEDSSLLGKSEVFVRMRPTSTKAGTSTDYDAGEIVEGRETALNYFAIRYNK